MTRNITPLGGMRQQGARSMRNLADKVQKEHPGMMTHKHIRDAAAQLERGNSQGASRHLYAAVHELQPQTLMRHGHLTDDVHAAAKQNMGLVHREVLRVRDIQDTEARNQGNIERMRAEKLSAAETPAAAPRPSAAMNAPNKIPVGRTDGAAAGPASPQPYGSKQFANGPAPYHREADEVVTCPYCHKGNSDDARFCDQCGRALPDSVFADLSNIELVGPKGYVHGWIKVNGPQSFGAGMRPGSFEHLRAIDDLADRAGQGPTGDPAHASPTMQAALHNLTKSLAARDMKGAKIHLESAKWANRREAGGSWGKELGALEHQLSATPKATYMRGRPDYNPLAARSQHPGKYVSSRSEPPANVTADVRQVIGSALTMSAETGRLAVTPAPYGKPGGPGLYNVKGNKHSDYFEQIVKALMEKRGMDKGKASRIAWGALRKWQRGGGHVHPEVRAAASGALAEEDVARARAHSNDDLREIFDLAVVMELTGTAAGAQKDTHSAATGQFVPPGAQQAKKAGPGSQKTASTKASNAAVAARAKQKAQIMQKIKGLRTQLNGLLRQYRALAFMPSSSSSSPSRSGSAATAAKAGAAAASTAAAPATAAASKTGTAASSRTAPTSPVRALTTKQIAQRAALHQRIQAIRHQIRTLSAQAAKL